MSNTPADEVQSFPYIERTEVTEEELRSYTHEEEFNGLSVSLTVEFASKCILPARSYYLWCHCRNRNSEALPSRSLERAYVAAWLRRIDGRARFRGNPRAADAFRFIGGF